MTNEELLSVAEIVEKLTDRFNAQAALHRERHNEYDKLIASMNDDHEAKMVEYRAAFGARTEADRKIIAGLREESAKCQAELDDLYQREGIEQKRRMDAESERDGLLTQVQDMRAEMQRLSAQLDWERAEIKRLQWENVTMHKDAEDGYAAAIKVLGDPVALSKERDALRAEVEFLKTLRPKYKVGDKLQLYPAIRYTPVTVVGVRTVYDCQADGAEYPVGHSEDELTERYEQTPKHPVKEGEWVKASNGAVAQVLGVHKDWYLIARGHGWTFANCEPCDPPNHDTEAGKAAAESAAQHSAGIDIGTWSRKVTT